MGDRKKNLTNGGEKVVEWWRIPNLVSEFKSDNIWPLFGQQKTVKIAKSCILLFFPKRCQILSDLNRETRFRILSSYPNCLTPICKDLHNLIFLASNSNFQNLNHIRTDQSEHFWENNLYYVYQREKTHQNGGSRVKIITSWKVTNPSAYAQG